jgi:hypothetical protein
MIRCNVAHDDAMIDDDEGDWVLYSDCAKLEAKQETLIRWLVEACQIPSTELWAFQGWRTSAEACEAAIRKALETPNSGERREGDVMDTRDGRIYTQPEVEAMTSEDQKYMRPMLHHPTPVQRATRKIGRNDPCPCLSGRNFKKC